MLAGHVAATVRKHKAMTSLLVQLAFSFLRSRGLQTLEHLRVGLAISTQWR